VGTNLGWLGANNSNATNSAFSLAMVILPTMLSAVCWYAVLTSFLFCLKESTGRGGRNAFTEFSIRTE